jgi:hypothetical protein
MMIMRMNLNLKKHLKALTNNKIKYYNQKYQLLNNNKLLQVLQIHFIKDLQKELMTNEKI